MSVHSRVFLERRIRPQGLKKTVAQAMPDIGWLCARTDRFYDAIDVSQVMQAMLDVSHTISNATDLALLLLVVVVRRAEAINVDGTAAVLVLTGCAVDFLINLLLTL